MKLKKLQDRLRAVEQEVASLESEIAQHDAALADFKSVEETVRLSGDRGGAPEAIGESRSGVGTVSAELEEG